MILRLSEDEVKEAVAAWIRGKYTDVLFGSVEKEQVTLIATTAPRFNYAEIDLSKKPIPKDGAQSDPRNWSLVTGTISCGDDSPKKPEPPPKPEPPKTEKYTKGGIIP